jgi:hypothetical protein
MGPRWRSHWCWESRRRRPPAGIAHAAGSATAPAKAKRQALHQFTGVVTALDPTSITVEKTGKKPKTMVFTRHAEMKHAGRRTRARSEGDGLLPR